MFRQLITHALKRLAPPPGGPIELSAEGISLQIRWFGLVVGVLLANFAAATDPKALNGILVLGLCFTTINSALFLCKRVFLRDWPLLIAAMESLFIGLLCHFDHGLDSPFRFYYLLSLVCCAIRYSPRTTFATCGLDCLSYTVLFALTPTDEQVIPVYLLTVVILVWVTWAAGAMARLLKRTSDELLTLNDELRGNKNLLETRIADRTRELEDSQAQVLHQEKMAAFGLLAAGIAHEVGNPLTSISAVVQMLDRRDQDEYTRQKLGLVTTQLSRIQTILRELVTFSRPASDQQSTVYMQDVIDEALGIAKYYRGGKSRRIVAEISPDTPALIGVRDQLVQVVFNLVLNAIDATGKNGTIIVSACHQDGKVVLAVADNGVGIDSAVRERLFRPYFTTKKHGTGLGLFVLRRIAEAHGGTVDVESTPEGATFRVYLPVAENLPMRYTGRRIKSVPRQTQ
jgi:two-component system, NtrC family, sensor kinase